MAADLGRNLSRVSMGVLVGASIAVLWGYLAAPDAPPQMPLQLRERAELTHSSTEHGLADDDPIALQTRREVATTADSGARLRGATVSPAEVEALVRDLHDDDVYGNAERAVRRLTKIGDPAVPALERALRSEDRQQRVFAFRALSLIDAPPGPGTARLLAQGLRRRPDPEHSFGSATWIARYLAHHADVARPEITWAVHSDDPQQRLLASYVLALGRHDEPTLRRILLDHLRDNKVAGDALMAAHGLHALGPSVLPRIYDEMARTDQQARTILRSLTAALEGKPATRDGRMAEITRVYANPAVQFSLDRSVVPRIY